MFYNFEIKKAGTPPEYIGFVEFEQISDIQYKVVNIVYTAKYYNGWLNLSRMQVVAITDILRRLCDQNKLTRFRVEERTIVSIGEKGVSVSIRNGEGYEESGQQFRD
jgi:hypothetical protein